MDIGWRHTSNRAKGIPLTDASGASGRVADGLRERIVSGALKPGTRLSEEVYRAQFGISRSTLREAFQLLIRERLLVHELSRGVFVRSVTRDDIEDLYRTRRIVECAAIRQVESLSLTKLRQLSSVIEEGQAAAETGDVDAIHTANVHFHEVLVSLADCHRLSSIMHGILAEFRLIYSHVPDDSVVLGSYLGKHVEIVDALRAGDIEGAVELLDTYLAETAAEVLARYID